MVKVLVKKKKSNQVQHHLLSYRLRRRWNRVKVWLFPSFRRMISRRSWAVSAGAKDPTNNSAIAFGLLLISSSTPCKDRPCRSLKSQDLNHRTWDIPTSVTMAVFKTDVRVDYSSTVTLRRAALWREDTQQEWTLLIGTHWFSTEIALWRADTCLTQKSEKSIGVATEFVVGGH